MRHLNVIVISQLAHLFEFLKVRIDLKQKTASVQCCYALDVINQRLITDHLLKYENYYGLHLHIRCHVYIDVVAPCTSA
jgi:hypothetical protein